MADFSTKKISQVYESLLHGDISDTATGLSDASTNIQLKTGNNTASVVHMTTDKVSLNQSCVVTSVWNRSSGQDLDVRSFSTAGAGGTIFAGEVTVWQGSATAWGTQSQGGKVNFKDGSSAPDADTSDNSFFLDNYHDGNDFALRCIRRESGTGGAGGADTDTQLFTALQKGGEAYFTIGDTATLEQFTCEGKISTAGTSLGPRYNEIYVNSRTSGTYPGDDDNPGTLTQPYKTLSKAMYNCSPYSNNVVYLYCGLSGDITTYNICTMDLKGLNISIRTVYSDTSGDGEIGEPITIGEDSAEFLEYRNNTKMVQSTTNELEVGGGTGITAQWKLWNGTSLSITGVTLEVSFPGTSTIGKDKTPFKMFYNAGGMLSLGRYLVTSEQSVVVNFTATNSDGLLWTVLLASEYSQGVLITKNVYYSTSAGIHNQANIDGPGTLTIRQSGHHYPETWDDVSPGIQHNEDIASTDTGTSYS